MNQDFFQVLFLICVREMNSDEGQNQSATVQSSDWLESDVR